MDYKKLLRALLSKAYKLDSGQIDELLDKTDENEAETSLLSTDSERVTKLTTPKTGQTFQDGYAKGKKEVLGSFEKEIKEKFGVNADVTGVELVELIVKDKGTGTSGGTLSDDDVKKSPAYQKLEADSKKAIKDKENEWEKKYNERETQITRSGNFAKAKSEALKILDGLKPVLPTSAAIAQNQKDSFADRFKDYEFDFQDGGRIVVMKDGKVVEDSHGNSVAFADLVKTTAGGYFEFQNNNGGGNAGNDNNNGGNGGAAGYPAGITKPTTFDEMQKIVSDETIKLEDRQTVMTVWETENP